MGGKAELKAQMLKDEKLQGRYSALQQEMASQVASAKVTVHMQAVQAARRAAQTRHHAEIADKKLMRAKAALKKLAASKTKLGAGVSDPAVSKLVEQVKALQKKVSSKQHGGGALTDTSVQKMMDRMFEHAQSQEAEIRKDFEEKLRMSNEASEKHFQAVAATQRNTELLSGGSRKGKKKKDKKAEEPKEEGSRKGKKKKDKKAEEPKEDKQAEEASKQKAAETKKLDEATKKEAEVTAKKAEEAKKTEEEAKKTEDKAKKEAETAKKTEEEKEE